jgi:hypothetical protein
VASKKLNVDVVRSELSGGSAFFPGYKGRISPTPPTPPPDAAPPLPVAKVPTTTPEPNRLREEPKQPIPVHSNARTPVRSNARRIITRNSFEIYEDQMDSLRRLAYLEKMEGKIGSMSAMVREAIDTYLKNKATEK